MERYRLVKEFACERYREDFLNGKLYMSSLGYFWSNGNEAQRDAAEGMGLEAEPMVLSALPGEFRRAQVHLAQILPAGFYACNILCFAMDTFACVNGQMLVETLGDPGAFGSHFVAIDDIRQFLDRVTLAVVSRGVEFAFGPVTYGPPDLADGRELGHHILLETDEMPGESIFPKGLPKTCCGPFRKSAEYASQREWRIALYRGAADSSPYVLDIGSIKDIAHEVACDDLYRDAELAARNPAAWSIAQTGGNISREALTNRFYELGDRKIKMYCTVG